MSLYVCLLPNFFYYDKTKFCHGHIRQEESRVINHFILFLKSLKVSLCYSDNGNLRNTRHASNRNDFVPKQIRGLRLVGYKA